MKGIRAPNWRQRKTTPNIAERLNSSSNSKADWSIFKGIPFWINDKLEHRRAFANNYNRELDNSSCCFNHLVGLPVKKGVAHPIYQYELDVLEAMKDYRRIYILKARGIGITEFLLRLFAWMCLYDNRYKYHTIPILVGPNIQLATDMIDRVKAIFRRKLEWYFTDRESRISINDVVIQAFPSHNPASYRGRKDVPAVLIDEADFLTPKNQDDVMDAATGYRAKTDPWVFLVSTPDAPRKLMDNIAKDDKSPWKKFFYDYTIGLEGHPHSKGAIFTQKEIEEAQLDPGFEREYNLKFLGRVGNIFRPQDIQSSLDNGKSSYDPSNPEHWPVSTGKTLGIDLGFSGSATGFCVLQMRNGAVEILYADDLETPLIEEVVEHAFKLIYRYSVNKIFIDSSNLALIHILKERMGEQNIGYEFDREGKRSLIMLNHVDQVRNHPVFSSNRCSIIPVNYREIGEEMLDHARIVFERGIVRIHPTLDKLATALKTARARESKLIKEDTAYNDVFDAWRQAMLAVQPYDY